MATYAIGDIQGCFGTFIKLLERCAFDPEKDRLWLVGDLVNRGPRSLETMRYIRALGSAAITVLGNHDLALLVMSEGHGKRSKGDRFDDILKAPDIDELLFWLRQQPLCHTEGDYCMVHAGMLPQWTTSKTQALAKEVEHALRAPNWQEFMANMWGNDPSAWSDELEGWPRLRVIVNALTRMRFCTPEGVIDFQVKGEVTTGPPGYLPWFEVPERCSTDKVLITGHWSALGLKMTPNLLLIDSGCLWGRALTAIRLEDREVFQVLCLPEEAQSW